MIIGYILAIASLSDTYSTGNDCLSTNNTICEPLARATTLSQAAAITMYTGAVFCLIGVVGLIFIKKK